MDFINEGKTGKVKLQDIFDNIYEDCDSVLADDFYKGLKPKMNQKKNIDLADAEVQLYIRDFLESHENDYQYDLLKQALEPYYDHAYDLADEDVQESYEVLEEDEYLDENATFEEIIYRMECAEIYEDLYNAAMLIVDPKLQNEVTELIQQCEDDGDEVEEAYSIVTSDLLDMHINDKNVENLNEDKKIKTEEYEPNIGSSSYDLGIDFNSYLEENDNVCSLLDYVKFTLATLEADLGPSGLDSFEEVPDFDEILDNIKQDIGQGDITIDDWNKEEAEDYFNDWLDDLNLEESKKIKIEAEENPQEFEYRMLARLKSDCDYYLGNGNRNAEHSLWAKNEDGQIAKMREIYNQLKEKPEWLSEEDINNYAKEMGVIDLPSTTDGTAEKEIQDMLDRAEKRSKEGLTESTEDKFSGTEFEKNIPHVMRFKEYDVKENDGVKTLYWVTQQFFTLEELEEFQNAFIELTSDKMNFKDAYVTVRDLSHYDLDKDYEDGVLCYVTAQSIDYEGYEDACEEYKFDLHKGWLDESKKITEAEDMEEVKDEVTDAAEKSNATDLEKEQVAGSIEVLKTDEESAIEGYEDFNEETSKVVDKELADAVEEQMEEIIEDEKEHIEKLDTIKDALDEAKGVAPDFKVDFEGDMTLNMGYTDKEGAKKRAEELIDDVAKSSNIKELNVDVKNVEEIEEDKKEEFLDANINVDTGDISPNLDLGGLGALAGLVASEEKKDSDKKLTENTVVWTSEYEGDEETAEEAYQEYLDEFESSAKTPKSFEMWLEDTKEVWFEAEAERYKEENPDKDPDKLTDFELDEINAELYDRVEKEIEANMDDLKEQYEEYCEEIKQEMTSPLDKEKWLTGWYEQDAQAQWEVKDEDFSNSVWPMIESQCKEDILILLGSVGRWDGTSGGGKIIYADEKNLRDTMTDYDEIRVEADDNNQISINYIHHDGTDSMYLYTIPEDLTELAKVMGYDDPDELDTDIRQDYVDMEELSKHVDKLTPIIYKGGNE